MFRCVQLVLPIVAPDTLNELTESDAVESDDKIDPMILVVIRLEIEFFLLKFALSTIKEYRKKPLPNHCY